MNERRHYLRRAMRKELCLMGCLLLWAVGCDNDDQSKAQNTAAPTASAAPKKAEVKWVGKRFSLVGQKARGTFSVPRPKDPKEGLMLRSYLYDFPDGTTAVFGDAKGTVEGPAPLVLNTSFRSRLADLSLKDVLRSQVDLKIKLDIQMPNGEKLSLNVPPQRISNAVAFELGRIESEPVKFEGEKPQTEPKLDTTAVVRVRSRTRQLRVIGDGEKLTDIDWIAIESDHGDRRTAECPRPGKKPRMVRLSDTEVVLYDRLTQKEKARKLFVAKPNCEHKRGVPRARELVDAWINEQMGRKPEPEKTALDTAAKGPGPTAAVRTLGAARAPRTAAMPTKAPVAGAPKAPNPPAPPGQN